MEKMVNYTFKKDITDTDQSNVRTGLLLAAIEITTAYASSSKTQAKVPETELPLILENTFNSLKNIVEKNQV